MEAKKNFVENTTEAMKKNTLMGLFEASINPRSIEDMEARGTAQLAMSSVLPAKGLTVFDPPYKEKWNGWHEKVGIKVIGPVEGDAIFVHVELPPGWMQKTTDHGMWNHLLDEKGRKRAGIFYKAAFYDRSAHIQPDTRFRETYEPVVKDDYGGPVQGIVYDCGKVVWKSEVFPPLPSWSGKPGETRTDVDGASKAAQKWLKEKYPNYQDPTAYWE